MGLITLLSIFEPYRQALIPRGYIKLRSIRVLGIVLSVFCRREHLIHVKNLEAQYTRLSFGGFLVGIF